jgi:DNA-binding beta-propeller fold protein YncE
VDQKAAKIRFLEPSSFAEVAAIDVPVNPHELAISGDHSKAYFPIYGNGFYGVGQNPHPDHRIVVVDLNTRTISDTVDVSPCRGPHAIQVDAQGLLYVSCELARTLLIVDPAARKVIASVDTDGTGHFLAVLPDGSKAYVANKDDRPFVTVINLKTQAIVARVPVPGGTEAITASPDGRQNRSCQAQ